jgi:hypothetical protein
MLTTKAPLYSKDGEIIGIAGIRKKIHNKDDIIGIVGSSHAITIRKELQLIHQG